jgi:ATP-binding cassette subfamily G (WHITE) protein 2 (SNQ2)
MANEFHTLNGECSTLVPSGPGYEGLSLSNQVCPIVGAEAGQSTVNGARYANESFNYSFGHIWRVSVLHLCGDVSGHSPHSI